MGLDITPQTRTSSENAACVPYPLPSGAGFGTGFLARKLLIPPEMRSRPNRMRDANASFEECQLASALRRVRKAFLAVAMIAPKRWAGGAALRERPTARRVGILAIEP